MVHGTNCQRVGKTDDYQFFLEKSYNYRNILTGDRFFHLKIKKESLLNLSTTSFQGDGSKGILWREQCLGLSVDVPHNVADLIELMGKSSVYTKLIRRLMNHSEKQIRVYAQLPDHTGNVQFLWQTNPRSIFPTCIITRERRGKHKSESGNWYPDGLGMI